MLNRPSKAVVTRVVGIVGALVALSAFLVLSNVPGSVFGQEPGVIMYAENGTAPVLTFTSEDPEGAGIHWDVTGVDANDFMISGGVLTFREPPNYEKPMDREVPDGPDAGDDADDAAGNNMYHITVRASEMRGNGEMGRALSTETDVTVQVTNRNEMGTVTLSRLQPEVATPITATLIEPDDTDDPTTDDTEEGLGPVVWQWYVSNNNDPVIDTDSHWIVATVDG